MKSASIDSTGASRGNLKTYVVGFILAVVLTVIPFGLVMSGGLPRNAMVWGIGIAGIAQILVHLHFFLHLNTSSAARWNLMVLLFTLLIMVIFVGGTMWIMFTLNCRMMP